MKTLINYADVTKPITESEFRLTEVCWKKAACVV